jgi:hypothetical protein
VTHCPQEWRAFPNRSTQSSAKSTAWTSRQGLRAIREIRSIHTQRDHSNIDAGVVHERDVCFTPLAASDPVLQIARRSKPRIRWAARLAIMCADAFVPGPVMICGITEVSATRSPKCRAREAPARRPRACPRPFCLCLRHVQARRSKPRKFPDILGARLGSAAVGDSKKRLEIVALKVAV